MVDLLATKLDGAGEIRTVDPRAAPSTPSDARRGGSAPRRGPASGGQHRRGRRAAAGHGHPLRPRRRGRRERGARRPTARPGCSSWWTSWPASSSRRRAWRRGTRLTRLAALTTGSLDALKAYLGGERELRAGRYFDAMEGFQAAVDADPSFALAHYRLAAAAAGCALPDLAREAADRGCGAPSSGSRRTTGWCFSAQRAWLHGAVDDAESLYNTITGTYPDDVEAWFHLGDLLFHSNPLRGRSAAEAREPFERVIAARPRPRRGDGASGPHLRDRGAHRRDARADRADSRSASPDGDQALAMRALRAYATRDASGIGAITAELQQARAITVAIAFADVALYSGNLAGATELARGFLQVARAPELRALCHVLLAHLALASGSPASDALPSWPPPNRSTRPGGSRCGRSSPPCPSFAARRASCARSRDALERWDPCGVAAEHVRHLRDAQRPAPRASGASCWACSSSAWATWRRAAERLEALAELEAGGPLVRNFTVELRAATRARPEGGRREALARLERARPELWFQLTVASPFFSSRRHDSCGRACWRRWDGTRRRRGGTVRWRSGRPTS